MVLNIRETFNSTGIDATHSNSGSRRTYTDYLYLMHYNIDLVIVTLHDCMKMKWGSIISQ